MCVNKEELLADIFCNAKRKDMLMTYMKIIMASKGFIRRNDKTYVLLGANEYEIIDDEFSVFLERNMSDKYAPVVIEK